MEWSYGSGGNVDDEVAAVGAIYAAFARRDIDAALVWVAPDVELHLRPTGDRAGHAGPYRGHDGVREYFADAERVWSDLTLRADSVRATKGGVVVFGRVSGNDGVAMVERRVVWTWKMQDGRATSVTVSELGDLT